MRSIQALVIAGALWSAAALAQEGQADMRGLTVSVGGGMEGYSGSLAPRIDPGVTYGATLGLKPSRVLGVELGYTGAVNPIDLDGREDVLGDPDIVRNGGQAVATLGITATPIQPYILGGIGIHDYNVRSEGEALGYSDDTVGSIPLGGGLRFHNGDFNADLRANYNLLFDEEFAAVAPGAAASFSGGNSYNATLNIGATF